MIIYFPFKDLVHNELISGAVYKYQCGPTKKICYSESTRQVNLKSGDHIRIFLFSHTSVNLLKTTAVCDHLCHCNYVFFFDNFTV